MGPKFCSHQGNEFSAQLGPMSITKRSPNWACQMGPILCPKFLLSGQYLLTYYNFDNMDDDLIYLASTTYRWPTSHQRATVCEDRQTAAICSCCFHGYS